MTHLAKFVNGSAFGPSDFADDGVPVVRIKHLLDNSAETDLAPPPANAVWLTDGDLVFSWSATLAVRFWRRGPALLNQHLYRVDTGSRVDRRWFAYVLEEGAQRLVPLMHGSAMTHITQDMLRSVTVQLPDLEEQRGIADYLDRETARIDALIDAKERMVSLIDDRWHETVSQWTHARTAVDATSTLPKGWRMMSLRRCLNSADYGIGESSSPQGAYGVLSMSNVSSGHIIGPPGGFVDTVSPRLLLSPGDLLFNRTNSRELVGKVGLVRAVSYPTTFASYLVRLRVGAAAEARYLNYLLNSREILGLARSMALPSIGQANLNPSRYSAMHLPIPPIVEQKRISQALDEMEATTRRIVETCETQVSLLRERRHALITAAVTGQIEVPGTA